MLNFGLRLEAPANLAMRHALLAFVVLMATARVACGADIYQIAVIPGNTLAPFWQSVHAGAEKARLELAAQGISLRIIWQGPAKENDIAEQVHILEQFVSRPVHGVVLAPLDRKELCEPVATAVGHRIPVIAMDSRLDSKAPLALVASNNYEAGRMAARCLAKLIGGMGNVILLRHHIHAANTEEREEGFLAVMRNEFPDIKLLVTDYHAGPTRATAKRVAELLIGRHRGDLQGIGASSECAVAGVLPALRDLGLAAGKVKVVAIEDEGDILRKALKTGDVQGMVVQDPAAMGYHAVIEVVAALRGKPVTEAIETGTRLITRDNLKELSLPFCPDSGALTTAARNATQLDTEPCRIAAARGEYVVSELGLVMVAIPPGTFDMGAAAAGPQPRGDEDLPVRVTLSRGFWLGKYEVMQREWRAIMVDNPSDFVGDRLPVDNVSWDEAMRFCRALDQRERVAGRLPKGYSYSLPTEAQWEYACRAGGTETGLGNIDDVAWHAGNSGSWAHPSSTLCQQNDGLWRMTTHGVGQKRANAWGLFDMCGNVAEWCFDWYGPYVGGVAIDPTGPSSGSHRVLRGGCWWTDPQNCTAIQRAKAPAGRHHSGLGFRLALSAGAVAPQATAGKLP